MPIVEVTLPPITPQIEPTQTVTDEIITPESIIALDVTSNDSPHIIIPGTQNQTDNTSTETQHENPSTKDGDENNLPYHDANKYWNALKIKRQRTVKGNIQYLIKWEDRNYPDTWTDASDVNDELKRVFYLTHTKGGTRRKIPIKDPNNTPVTNIQEEDEWSDCQEGEELLI